MNVPKPMSGAPYLAPKLYSALACMLCAGTLFASAPGGSVAKKPVLVEGVAAYVDGKTVLISDVHKMVVPLYEKMRRTSSKDELEARLKVAYKESLQALVDQNVILSHNAKLDKKALKPMVKEREEELVRERFGGDRASFLSAMASEGTTLEEWRGQLRDRIMVSLVQRKEISGRMMIAPGSVWRAYERNVDKYRSPEQVKVRTIRLLKGRTAADNEVVRKKAEGVLKRLADGTAFEALVEAFSEEGKQAGASASDWVAVAELPAAVAKAAAALEAGQASGIVDGGDAFLIVKVEGRRAANVKPIEEVWDDIEQDLEKQEYERLYDEWTAKLRQQSYVKIVDR